ncbi:MAG: hypothetical protein MUC49_02250 [Raineya sp.]|jgi:hypothetical protein|nr:hypothetical protein [Raineya sp.]
MPDKNKNQKQNGCFEETTVYMPKDLHDEAKEEAASLGTNYSSFMRSLFIQYKKQQQFKQSA